MSKLYPGNSYLETLKFKDGSSQLFDPDSVAIEFLTPSRVVAGTLALVDLERTAEGVYQLVWALPLDAVKGTWTRKVTFAVEGLVKTGEEPFNVAVQPYGVLSVVKRLCNLSEVDDQDSTLLGFMDDATEWINTVLRRHGEPSLPLDPVPVEVARVASYYAAGLFLQRDLADGKRHYFAAEAKEDLEAYAQAAYHGYVVSAGKVKVSSYSEIDED